MALARVTDLDNIPENDVKVPNCNINQNWEDNDINSNNNGSFYYLSDTD